MIEKIKDYNQALDAIENIDSEITELLKQNDKYSDIMNLMQKRLVFISELLRLKDNKEASEEIKHRIKKIFDSAQSLQEKVKDKRDKIKKRLEKNKKLEMKNKNLKY